MNAAQKKQPEKKKFVMQKLPKNSSKHSNRVFRGRIQINSGDMPNICSVKIIDNSKELHQDSKVEIMYFDRNLGKNNRIFGSFKYFVLNKDLFLIPPLGAVNILNI